MYCLKVHTNSRDYLPASLNKLRTLASSCIIQITCSSKVALSCYYLSPSCFVFFHLVNGISAHSSQISTPRSTKSSTPSPTSPRPMPSFKVRWHHTHVRAYTYSRCCAHRHAQLIAAQAHYLHSIWFIQYMQ